MTDRVKFKISSGLKNIIGRDLITDDYIAVFELVKNSFDAHATEVDIIFGPNKIVIIDNGKGMSYNDLIEKWLFVAYSAKKVGIEDENLQENEFKDYRDKLSPKKFYAGAKGIGRFSCDRLGGKLKLITKSVEEDSCYEQLQINWEEFERDPNNEFVNVEISHSRPTRIDYMEFEHGTLLEITNLNSAWPRDKKLELKHSLEKLINPFSASADLDEGIPPSSPFNINIYSEVDHEGDALEDNPRNKVNGPVSNFIFEILNVKTTKIITVIDPDGRTIRTTLKDRGEVIYKISEPNDYPLLRDVRFVLFYLNHAAKLNFKRIMGIDSVSFGSVFLFKNGFRIYPFGEAGEDTLGLDRRKSQGQKRFLGTREVIGRIEIFGSEDSFRETSSRDGGLIKNPSYNQLIQAFYDKCLKRIEKYVVDVTWALNEDKYVEDTSLISQNVKSQTKIASIISRVAGSSNIVLEEYNKDLLEILEDKLEAANPNFFKSLDKIARRTKDITFLNQIQSTKDKYFELLKEKEEAERQKEEEARKRAEIEEALAREQKKNLFLTAHSSSDIDHIVSLHHQIGISSDTINNHIKRLYRRAKNEEVVPNDLLIDILQRISFENKKILAITRFATKANFMLESESIAGNLDAYIVQYLDNVSRTIARPLKLEVSHVRKEEFFKSFKPIEVSIIFDNLISNSRRAGATTIEVQVESDEDTLEVRFRDNGKGVDPNIASDIFSLGATTTQGSGIGLYHVRSIVNSLNGEITLNRNFKNGAEFVIQIHK